MKVRGAEECSIQEAKGVAALGKWEQALVQSRPSGGETHWAQLHRAATSLYWKPLPTSHPTEAKSSLSAGTWVQESVWLPGGCYYPEEMRCPQVWPYFPSLPYNPSWQTGKQTLHPLTEQQSSNQRWSFYKLESPKGKSTPQKREAKHLKKELQEQRT